MINAAMVGWCLAFAVASMMNGAFGFAAVQFLFAGGFLYALRREYKRGYRYEKTQWSRK